MADAKNQGLQDAGRPEAFIPYRITGAFGARHPGAHGGTARGDAEAVRREIWAVDRNIALT